MNPLQPDPSFLKEFASSRRIVGAISYSYYSCWTKLVALVQSKAIVESYLIDWCQDKLEPQLWLYSSLDQSRHSSFPPISISSLLHSLIQSSGWSTWHPHLHSTITIQHGLLPHIPSSPTCRLCSSFRSRGWEDQVHWRGVRGFPSLWRLWGNVFWYSRCLVLWPHHHWRYLPSKPTLMPFPIHTTPAWNKSARLARYQAGSGPASTHLLTSSIPYLYPYNLLGWPHLF